MAVIEVVRVFIDLVVHLVLVLPVLGATIVGVVLDAGYCWSYCGCSCHCCYWEYFVDAETVKGEIVVVEVVAVLEIVWVFIDLVVHLALIFALIGVDSIVVVIYTVFVDTVVVLVIAAIVNVAIL